jgi:flagellar hook assembly protein FlgD
MKKRLIVLCLLVFTFVLFAGNKSSDNISDFKVSPEAVSDLAIISFHCNTGVHLTIEILNQEGQVVTTIASTFFNVGDYTLEWDRTDFAGNLLANGNYTVQVKENKRFVTKRKTLILK